MIRRTKIVCTIGPASDTEEMIAKLITAGMNVARLNFSHGTSQYQRELVQKVKRVRKALNKPVAILQDLQGPKIRIGIRSYFKQRDGGRESSFCFVEDFAGRSEDGAPDSAGRWKH